MSLGIHSRCTDGKAASTIPPDNAPGRTSATARDDN